MVNASSENIQDRAVRELGTLAAQFAAAETELIEAYFKGNKRSPETDAHWSKKQSGREFESAVTGLEKLIEHWQEAKAGRIAFDRKWFEEEYAVGAQEMNHANIYFDYLEATTGETADCVDIYRRYNRWNPDPSSENITEWMKLAELFKQQEQLAEKNPVVELAASNGLLEGGSCGLFYALSKLTGEERDVRLADGNKKILHDERGHGPSNVYEVPKLIKSEKDLEKVKNLLFERGKQRLRMRNEQFNFPLSDERMKEMVEEVAAGKIDLRVFSEIWGDDLYNYVVAA